MLTWLVLAAALILAAVALRARRRAAIAGERLEASARALETLQAAFARFAPARVVEDIIAEGVSTRSESKEVTVLFADLQGFTALTERLDPVRLVAVLNGYFEAMSRAIAAHRGHLAKFLGDGLLALFGALEHDPWQAHDAVRAALAMRRALAEYNATLARDGMSPLVVGIGIHRGPVVAGVIGTAGLVEYGVVGQTVNLASRVGAHAGPPGRHPRHRGRARRARPALSRARPAGRRGEGRPGARRHVRRRGLGRRRKLTRGRPIR